MMIGFLLVGPAPFLTSLVPTTGLIKGAAAIFGIGYPMIVVTTFGRSFAFLEINHTIKTIIQFKL